LTNVFLYDTIKEKEIKMKKITPKLIKGMPKQDGLYLEENPEGYTILVEIKYDKEIGEWTISDYPNLLCTDVLDPAFDNLVFFGPLDNIFD
jgi:hypothetical protein